MTPLKILRSKGIDPNEAVFVINREVALERLIEAIEEFCQNLRVIVIGGLFLNVISPGKKNQK